MDQLVEILQDSLSHDQLKLNSASLSLSRIMEENYPWLLQALIYLLSSCNQDSKLRQQAGLQAKLLLQNQQKLSSLDHSSKCTIKDNLFRILGSETWRPSTVAICLQAMFETDDSDMVSWSQLIHGLVTNVTTDNTSVESIETLGYLCATNNKKHVLEENINVILTGVIYCVSSENIAIKTAGLVALIDSIECAAVNFARKGERDYIMQKVCEVTLSDQTELKSLSIECLNKIITCYYPLIENYLRPALIPISIQSIQSNHEKTVLQGIEFWCNICDLEESMSFDEENILNKVIDPDVVDTLVDSLLALIVNARESDPDMEVWSISSAAVQCLSQLCEFFSTPVDNKIGSFIQVYINSSDINLKFTSIICVSTLLSMQDQQSKVSVVSSFLQISQDLLSDSCFNIKYAASFVLYKISEISLSIILQDQQMIQTFENLCLSCINSEQPKVVENGCYSIGNFYREISNFNGEIFMKIFNRLLFLSEAQTSQQIQQAVSSSIIDIVEHFPLEYYKLLVDAGNYFLNKLSTKLIHENCPTRSMFYCSIFYSIIQSMKEDDVLSMSANIFEILPILFHTEDLLEDAFLILRAMICPIGNQMVCHIPSIMSLSISHLQNTSKIDTEPAVVKAVLGVMADLVSEVPHLEVGLFEKIILRPVIGYLLPVQSTETVSRTTIDG